MSFHTIVGQLLLQWWQSSCTLAIWSSAITAAQNTRRAAFYKEYEPKHTLLLHCVNYSEGSNNI